MSNSAGCGEFHETLRGLVQEEAPSEPRFPITIVPSHTCDDTLAGVDSSQTMPSLSEDIFMGMIAKPFPTHDLLDAPRETSPASTTLESVDLDRTRNGTVGMQPKHWRQLSIVKCIVAKHVVASESIREREKEKFASISIGHPQDT